MVKSHTGVVIRFIFESIMCIIDKKAEIDEPWFPAARVRVLKDS
jgi:hypothetical protein